MFDDLPHNLATAHAIGMTTVWIDCRATGRPEHQSSEEWATLPDHIHHCTEALAPFLTAIGMALAEDAELPATPLPHAQFCLT